MPRSEESKVKNRVKCRANYRTKSLEERKMIVDKQNTRRRNGLSTESLQAKEKRLLRERLRMRRKRAAEMEKRRQQQINNNDKSDSNDNSNHDSNKIIGLIEVAILNLSSYLDIQFERESNFDQWCTRLPNDLKGVLELNEDQLNLLPIKYQNNTKTILAVVEVMYKNQLNSNDHDNGNNNINERIQSCFDDVKEINKRRIQLIFKLESNSSIEISNEYPPRYIGTKNGVLTRQIDLHFLTQMEATSIMKSMIDHFRGLNQNHKMKVIVGKGKHSVDNLPKIGPAVQKLLIDQKIQYEVYKGHLIVYFRSQL